MPTVAQLQDYIRDHKQKNCPSYSKLKKAQLLTLAKELGYVEGLKPKTRKQMIKEEIAQDVERDRIERGWPRLVNQQKDKDGTHKAEYIDRLEKQQYGKTDSDGRPEETHFDDEKTYMNKQTEYKKAMKKDPGQYLLIVKDDKKKNIPPHYRKMKYKYYKARKLFAGEIMYWTKIQCIFNTIGINNAYERKDVDYKEAMKRMGIQNPTKVLEEFNKRSHHVREFLDTTAPNNDHGKYFSDR